MARAATFTTYLNAQLDGNADRVFNQFATNAVSRYATIEKAATTASRATAGLLGGSGSAGLGNTVNKVLTDRTTAITGMTRAAERASTISSGLTTSLRKETAVVDQAARSHQQLSKSLQTTATALNVVQGPLGPIAGRVTALSRAVSELTGFRLGLVGIGASLFTIGRLGNDYTTLSTKLRPFFNDQQQANQAMQDAIGIAARSRQSLEATIGLYSRLIAVSKDYGLSIKTVNTVTEGASKAALLSGGTSQTREAGLLQFSQAIGSGKLGGDELRSILENIPVLAQTIAHNFQNADGSIGTTIGNLRKLGAQGQLTTDKIVAAVQRGLPELNRQIETLPTTLSSATTALANTATVMIGQLDQALGFTNKLATSIQFTSDNLRGLTAVAVGFGAAFAASRVLPFFDDLATRISTTIAANRQLNTESQNVLNLARQLATQQVATAAAEVNAIRQEVAEREADVVAIQAEIAALREQRAQALLNAQATTALSGVGGAAGAANVEASAAAQAALTTSTRQLAQAEQELAQVEGALRLGKADLEGATNRLGSAVQHEGELMRTTAPKFGLVRTAIDGLKTAGLAVIDMFGGPWGIAIGAAVTALYLLATAESTAEQATKSLQDAQIEFGNHVDSTTGKIYDQIGALQRLDFAKKQGDALATGIAAAKQTKASIIAGLTGFTGRYSESIGIPKLVSQSPAEKELATALNNFKSGQKGSGPELERALIKLAPIIDREREKSGRTGLFTSTLSSQLGDYGNLFSQFRTQIFGKPNDPASSLKAQAARARIAAGKEQPGDLELARGNVSAYSANGTGKPKTKSQLLADAKALAAQTDLQRAQANLDQVKANGKQPGESDIDYENRLAAAMQGVTSAQQAQTAARKAAAQAQRDAKKAARDAIQDAKDEAAARRDAALTALYQSGKDPQSEEFIQERIKILKTYDDEVNKIDASKAASRSAAAQMIQDAKDVAAAAAKRSEERDSILANYDDNAKSIDRARAAQKKIQGFVGKPVDNVAFIGQTAEAIDEIKKDNPLGTGIYTQEMADADKSRIEQGLRKPLRDIFLDSQRQLEINKLILQGREAEANALQKAFSLYDSIGHVSQQEYEALVKNEEAQLRINDALASRQRVVGQITGALDQARNDVSNFIVDLGTGKKPSAGKLFGDIQTSLLKVKAQQFTESLFSGADQRVRDLISGKSKTDRAIDNFADSMGKAESATDKIVGSFNRAADKIDSASTRLADSINNAAGGSVPNVGATPANVLATAANGGITSLDQIGASVAAGLGALFGKPKSQDVGGDPTDIIVTGTRAKASRPAYYPDTILPQSVIPNTKATTKAIFGGLFDSLDGLVDKISGKTRQADGSLTNAAGDVVGGSKFFKGLSDAFGQALGGAQTGGLVSGIANAVGIKLNSTGAQIGGALGSFIPIPGGDIIGSVVGGLIGNLFTKPKKSSAGIGLNQYGELGAVGGTGSNAQLTAAANTLAGSVSSGIQGIADALGAKITGTSDVKIGTYDGKIRVNDHGGAIGGVKGSGAITFPDEQSAIEYAIRDALSDGILTGISQASLKILKSGQDLQRALNKALAIESIPKQLLRLTDPVKAAVNDLNDQFTNLISYLKEGGATAQQFADAQKLYDLERQQAIKQAMDEAASAINDFLTEMTGGQSSPYNKLTVYQNASATLGGFKSDIAAGKVVDQNDLLTAARNFEDASRSLYGSGQSFFSDFDMLRGLLEKARDNAGITDVSTLPKSPFDDSSIQQIIGNVATDQTIKDQTKTLGDKLDNIVAVLNNVGISTDFMQRYYDSPIELLPKFKTG